MPDDPIFDRLYYKIIKHRDLNGPLYCELTSAIFASAYADLVGTTYIIDTDLHSVVSEGEHTWDLNNGIVFYNHFADQKDQNKEESTQASLDSDYDIEEYKLDEELVDTDSDKQSSQQVIEKKNINVIVADPVFLDKENKKLNA